MSDKEPTPREALEMLDGIAARVQLTRDDHERIAAGVAVLWRLVMASEHKTEETKE